MTEGEGEATIDALVDEAQSAISGILAIIRSNARSTRSAQGASTMQMEVYASSQLPSMTALIPAGVHALHQPQHCV
jgi:hypothetical protein